MREGRGGEGKRERERKREKERDRERKAGVHSVFNYIAHFAVLDERNSI